MCTNRQFRACCDYLANRGYANTMTPWKTTEKFLIYKDKDNGIPHRISLAKVEEEYLARGGQ